MIGQTVSHYQIVEKLGEGGMGVVYKAVDTRLHRNVAIKFLPTELKSDEQAKKRFTREARAASSLNHSHIAVVHEVDETADGRMFMVMAYYEGPTLKQRLANGPLPLKDAVKVMSEIAAGLHAAHGKGILHRDIKPGNILFGEDGEARLADFGLAALVGRTRLTRTGTTVGTVSYMSPEQARGDDVDQRSDIFSLGVVLYQVVTGELPFTGDHDAAITYQIMNKNPEPLSRYRSGTPSGLQSVVSTALAKEPDARYENVKAMLADLEAVARGEEIAGTGENGRRRIGSSFARRGAVIVTACAIALLAAYYAYSRYSARRAGASHTHEVMIVVLPFENLGPGADDYFAGGITEEITSRLAAVRKLGVIARTTAVKYSDTDKTLEQIGKELKVDYALEGTVRWDTNTSGERRIRVTPQLIDVADGTHVWSERYDRVLDDIFEIQSDIASRVVHELDITVSDPERRVLAHRPTDNFDAYRSYLAGIDLLWSDYERAARMFQRAVQFDPTCAPCYAELSQMHAKIYHYGLNRTQTRLAAAESAARKAVELAPSLPDAHIAMGYYYYWCRSDYDRALAAFAKAEEGRPNDSRVLAGKAYIWRRTGQFEEAMHALESALALNPLSHALANAAASSHAMLGQYDEAERLADLAISLAPHDGSNYDIKAWIQQLRGDLQHARATLMRSPDQGEVARRWFWQAFYERRYGDALAVLNATATESFSGHEYFEPKALLEGFALQMSGATEVARSRFDAARVTLEKRVEEQPDDHRYRVALGFAHAAADRPDDAVREGRLAVEMLPVSKDAFDAPARMRDLALIYCMVGDTESAVDELAELFSLSGWGYWVSVPLLRLDPLWDRIREDRRFKELLARYSGGKT